MRVEIDSDSRSSATPPASVMSAATADDPDHQDEHRRNGQPEVDRARSEARAVDDDRKERDDERSLDDELQRSGAVGERPVAHAKAVKQREDDGLDRDPAEDVPGCDAEVVRERRRDHDRNLGEVGRDGEEDRAAERLAKAEPLREHVGCCCEPNAGNPDRRRRSGEAEHEEAERHRASAHDAMFSRMRSATEAISSFAPVTSRRSASAVGSCPSDHSSRRRSPVSRRANHSFPNSLRRNSRS
jgi:hypothetical protein